MVIVVQYQPMVLGPTCNCGCPSTPIEAPCKGPLEIMLFGEREILVAALFDMECHDISRHVIFAPSSTNVYGSLPGLATLWQMLKVIMTG